MEVDGLIGYPTYTPMPAAIIPSATASLPLTRSRLLSPVSPNRGRAGTALERELRHVPDELCVQFQNLGLQPLAEGRFDRFDQNRR